MVLLVLLGVVHLLCTDSFRLCDTRARELLVKLATLLHAPFCFVFWGSMTLGWMCLFNLRFSLVQIGPMSLGFALTHSVSFRAR